MILEKKFWHYDYFAEWYIKVFGKSITKNNIVSKLKHTDKVFKIVDDEAIEHLPDAEDRRYYEVMKDEKSYIMPQRFIDKTPFIVEESYEVRLKKSDNVIYHLITDVTELTVPSQKFWSVREYIDGFNPVHHTVPKSKHFLTMFTHGVRNQMGICTLAGGGKNSGFNILTSLGQKVDGEIIKPSKPMLWSTLKACNRVNFDEITSWGKPDVRVIEEDVAKLTDNTTNKSKNTLNRNNQIEKINYAKKGCSFTFNPVSKNNPITFDMKWGNGDKIHDRIPLLFLNGKVEDRIRKPRCNEVEYNIYHNPEVYNTISKIAAQAEYLRTNIHKETHGYNTKLNPFKNRYADNSDTIIEWIDAYCLNQNEFDEWMIWLQQRVMVYDMMVQQQEKLRNYNLTIKTQKEEYEQIFEQYEEMVR